MTGLLAGRNMTFERLRQIPAARACYGHAPAEWCPARQVKAPPEPADVAGGRGFARPGGHRGASAAEPAAGRGAQLALQQCQRDRSGEAERERSRGGRRVHGPARVGHGGGLLR